MAQPVSAVFSKTRPTDEATPPSETISEARRDLTTLFPSRTRTLVWLELVEYADTLRKFMLA